MKFNFKGDIAFIKSGLEEILQELGAEIGKDGITVELKKAEALRIEITGDTAVLEFSEKTEIFRGCAIIIDKLKKGETNFKLEEVKKFDTCGIMIDCSRNAVPRVKTVKEVLRKMACMGLNMAMLYMEDTYKIDGYPYFGYMRGAYTKDELKEIDAYANMLGIELIPCIQTLGHLTTALYWSFAENIRDNGDVLLIDEPETYKLIEAMIKTAAECFTSKRIHIGMDEAHGVGLGNYLLKNGYKNRFDILASHLSKVMELLNKHGLKPMMWSDMFFCLGSKTYSYYDPEAEIPADIGEKIPENLSMVFWDYYHSDEELYDKMLKKHKEMGREVVFAGGIWLWRGMGVSYHKTMLASRAALKMCRKNGIRNVFATIWGDDGAEVPLKTAYLGMQLWAEHRYYDEVPDEKLEEMFKICTGYDMEAFLCFDCDNFDTADDVSTVTKCVLYQDVLCGLFDKNFEIRNVKESLCKTLEKTKALTSQGDMDVIFDCYKKMLEAVIEKYDIGMRISAAYKKKDKDELKKCLKSLESIKEKMQVFRKAYIDMWDKYNKPFGFDMLDMRIGGVLARIDTAQKRVRDFVNATTDKIEELEEEKLLFAIKKCEEEQILIECPAYHRIHSASSKLIY